MISATPTTTLRPVHLDAALVGFPSQAVSIILSLPLAFQGLGNHQWTSKQLQAACKMAMQVNMAKITNGNYSTILRMALQSTDRFQALSPI